MKNKDLIYKIFGIVLLIAAVILYFLLYLIPSLKSINRSKRQLKDTQLEIADFIKTESDFTFSDQRENRYFEQAEQELRGKIPEVKSREDIIALFAKISAYIQQSAQRDGILNLVLKPDSRELSVNTPGTGALPAGSGLASLVNHVKYHTLTLSFTGELKNALNFINHLSWCEYYLSEAKIRISAGEIFLNYIIFLKIYFIDRQGET
jgi:hypothetical protein